MIDYKIIIRIVISRVSPELYTFRCGFHNKLGMNQPIIPEQEIVNNVLFILCCNV